MKTTETPVRITVIIFAILFLIILSFYVNAWGSPEEGPSSVVVREQISFLKSNIKAVLDLPDGTSKEMRWRLTMVLNWQHNINALQELLDMIEAEQKLIGENWYWYNYRRAKSGGSKLQHHGVGGSD